MDGMGIFAVVVAACILINGYFAWRRLDALERHVDALDGIVGKLMAYHDKTKS